MRTLRITILVVAAALLAAGCRSARHAATEPTANVDTAAAPTAPTTPTTPRQPRQLTVATFTATVEGMTANGQLRMAEDSVLWATASKFFEIGRVMATPDSVWVNAPLAGVRFAGSYADVSARAKREVTFEKVQRMLTSADAERQMEELARMMGFNATIKISARRKVDTLTFPFTKP